MITGTFQLYGLIEYTGNYSNFSPISINIVARAPFHFFDSTNGDQPLSFIFSFGEKSLFFWKINELTSCVSALSFRSTRIACLDGDGLRARHISMGDGVDFKLVTSGFTTFPGLRSRRDRASCYPPSRYSWSLSAVSSGLTAKTWQDLLGNLSPPLKIYYQPLVSSNSSLLLRTPMHECSAFSSLLIANRHRNLLHPDKINLDESVKSTQRAKESVKEEESRQRFVLKGKFPSFAHPRSRNLIFLLG